MVEERVVDKRKLKVTDELCTGCMLCMLACTLIKHKTFSYSKALIDVQRVGIVERYSIDFKDGCNRCGFCTNYCALGAIAKPDRAERRRIAEHSKSLGGEGRRSSKSC